MIFDAPTFLLFVLALLGAHRRPAAVAGAIRRWKVVVPTLIVTGIILASLGLFEAVMVVSFGLLEIALWLLCVRVYVAVRTPGKRAAVRLVVAFLCHFLFVQVAPNIRMEAGHETTPMWFVDLMARAWLAVIEPALSAMGGQGMAEQVLTVLVPGLAFLGMALVPLQFVWSYVAVGLLLRLTVSDAYPEDETLTPTGIPWWMVGVLVLSSTVAKNPEAAMVSRLLFNGTMALFAIHGLWSFCAWCVDRWSVRLAVAAMVAVLVVAFANPGAWRLVGALGVLEVLSRSFRGGDGTHQRLAEIAVSEVRRSLGRMMLLGFLLPAMVVGSKFSGLITGVQNAPLAAPMEAEPTVPTSSVLRLLDHHGRPLEVDRYEYPNTLGELPHVGVTPEEARATCAARGARLCTADELGLVCSSGRGQRYLGGEDRWVFSSETLLRLQRECNFGHTRDQGPRRLNASGDNPDCRADWAVYDLVGNAHEWVALPDRPGFFGLSGSDYRYDDLRLLTCGAYVLVPAPFVKTMNLGTVGFRCCQ